MIGVFKHYHYYYYTQLLSEQNEVIEKLARKAAGGRQIADQMDVVAEMADNEDLMAGMDRQTVANKIRQIQKRCGMFSEFQNIDYTYSANT